MIVSPAETGRHHFMLPSQDRWAKQILTEAPQAEKLFNARPIPLNGGESLLYGLLIAQWGDRVIKSMQLKKPVEGESDIDRDQRLAQINQEPVVTLLSDGADILYIEGAQLNENGQISTYQGVSFAAGPSHLSVHDRLSRLLHAKTDAHHKLLVDKNAIDQLTAAPKWKPVEQPTTQPETDQQAHFMPPPGVSVDVFSAV
jgi:hypothetical protein